MRLVGCCSVRPKPQRSLRCLGINRWPVWGSLRAGAVPVWCCQLGAKRQILGEPSLAYGPDRRGGRVLGVLRWVDLLLLVSYQDASKKYDKKIEDAIVAASIDAHANYAAF